MAILRDIIRIIEAAAPPSYQESYDNSGLLTGDPLMHVDQVLIALDCTEEVMDEAVNMGCQLILTHHPILFSGLKRLTGATYIERVMMNAIRHNIAIYACHTNLDNMQQGVNRKIVEKLGLINAGILDPKPGVLRQLYVYVPETHAEKLREAIFAVGGGQIGAYSSCSFNTEGTGTFKPEAGSNPFSGQEGVLEKSAEVKIELVYRNHLEAAVLNAMREAHPYEEIAYGILNLENTDPYTGAGMIAETPSALSETEFLELLKLKLGAKGIRYTKLLGKDVRKVAVCGGAGSFLLKKAINAGADMLVTADFKYHQFFDAANKIVIADIGHYESEQFTGEIFYDLLSNKFPNFAVRFTSIHTNPINYF